jgi:alcohol dehydrogenase (NADP+)
VSKKENAAMSTLSYAAQSPSDALAPLSIKRRALRADDVAIDILYCGVCHTDLHLARNHSGMTTYPIVPGHEIIGRVTRVGPSVSRFKPGDTVGVGCMVDSCHHCAACESDQEQHCAAMPTFTYASVDRHDGTLTYGGYSEHIVVSDHFVLKVPDGLDLAGAAPLLCAGITTWSPLRRWNIVNGSHVAVVGLGGLGHMALKLAKAMGAHVTLFSRSVKKIEDAYRLGADEVVISTDATQMAAHVGAFDLIIDTVPYDHDVNPYLPTLAFHGALVLVGYLGPLDNKVNAGSLVFGGKSLAGSFIGGVHETQEMLDFCAEHGVMADVEVIRIQDINDAYERMLRSDVKYRFVIDMASLKP